MFLYLSLSPPTIILLSKPREPKLHTYNGATEIAGNIGRYNSSIESLQVQELAAKTLNTYTSLFSQYFLITSTETLSTTWGQKAVVKRCKTLGYMKHLQPY